MATAGSTSGHSASINPHTGGWALTGAMHAARAELTLTVLAEGRVLAAGGTATSGPFLSSAELYDPRTGQWTMTGWMHVSGGVHQATLLPNGTVLVTGPGTGAEFYDEDTGQWTITGRMHMARFGHTATLLSDGTVLAAGGGDASDSLASAEIYTPGSSPFVHLSPPLLLFGSLPVGASAVQPIRLTNTGIALLVVGSITIAGTGAAAYTRTTTCTGTAILPNGTCTIRVTFTPRSTGQQTAFIVIWDNAPNSPHVVLANGFGTGPNAWEPTGSMAVQRDSHTATLLPSGQVLVAGGSTGGPAGASAELYDPTSGRWRPTGSMMVSRSGQTATVLPNGYVLVAGGLDSNYTPLASAELYNPSTGTWSATGSMTSVRIGHTATLLPTGNVLVTGGCASSADGPACAQALTSAELYDPRTGTWSATGAMTAGRSGHTATLLGNGTVLVAGGMQACSSTCQFLASAEVYDPQQGTWSTTGSMLTAHTRHTATLLPSGQVLVAGGWDNTGFPTADAELYDPTTGRWMATAPLSTPRIGHTATLRANGTVLVAGGCNGYSCASSELYTPSTGTWTPTSSMVTPRLNQTATLLADGDVLAAGGDNPCCTPIATAELYTHP